MSDINLVGLRIRKIANVHHKVVPISLRRSDRFKLDMVWYVLGKVIQSNAGFLLSGRFEVHLDLVRIPLLAVKGLRRRKGGI